MTQYHHVLVERIYASLHALFLHSYCTYNYDVSACMCRNYRFSVNGGVKRGLSEMLVVRLACKGSPASCQGCVCKTNKLPNLDVNNPNI